MRNARWFSLLDERINSAWLTRASALWIVWALAGIASSQTQFELTAPTLNRTSRATLSARDLRVVDQEGRENALHAGHRAGFG